MKRRRASFLWVAGPAAGLFLLLWVQTQRIRAGLADPTLFTGRWLLAAMLLLAAFNARKKLSMLPLGNAATWLRLHVAGGWLALGLFWLHTGSLWPAGGYERLLAALFYLLTASGLLGYGLQRVLPARLTQSGLEVIYERIPAEVGQIREKAQSLLFACADRTGGEVLARHYLQTLDWFFRRPRFFWNHLLGGRKGLHWIHERCSAVTRYLSSEERSSLGELRRLAELKNALDLHYASQSVLKGWLLIHLPLSAATGALVLWHLIGVLVYAL